MLMVVKNILNNIKFLCVAVKCSIKSAVEYKISFLTQSVLMFVNNIVWLIFWSIMFNVNGSNINGVTFNTILYLWSLPVISFGISYFFFGGIDNINSYMITGQFDSYMLQPKYPLLNVMTSKCNFSAFGDMLYGLVIGLFAVNFDLVKYIILVVFGILGAVIYISTSIIIRSLSVWLGDTEIIANKYVGTLLTTFSVYPEQLFKGIVKILLYTVIPVGYMAYMPINFVITFNPKYLVLTLIGCTFFTALSIVIFNKAMKSYESGNTISMRN